METGASGDKGPLADSQMTGRADPRHHDRATMLDRYETLLAAVAASRQRD